MWYQNIIFLFNQHKILSIADVIIMPYYVSDVGRGKNGTESSLAKDILPKINQLIKPFISCTKLHCLWTCLLSTFSPDWTFMDSPGPGHADSPCITEGSCHQPLALPHMLMFCYIALPCWESAEITTSQLGVTASSS